MSRDDDYAFFIQTFGEPTASVAVPQSAIDKYRGKIHDKILGYWQQEGWCQFMNGLFWTVNPEDWQPVVDAWLAGTPFEPLGPHYAIARTAFGEVLLFSERTGAGTSITPTLHLIGSWNVEPEDEYGLMISAGTLFSSGIPRDFEVLDENEAPLFDAALRTLGPLTSDQIYAFEPPQILGGKPRLENLRKVRWDVHLMLLRQWAEPIVPVFDMGALLRKHGLG